MILCIEKHEKIEDYSHVKHLKSIQQYPSSLSSLKEILVEILKFLFIVLEKRKRNKYIDV